MKNELGTLDDANIAPSVEGQGKLSRAEEAKRVREEHRKNMARMKAAGKRRVGGFDRSKLNPNFATHAKKGKDTAAGWAFDFDNPDAGQVGGASKGDDDAIMQQVMADSLKESKPAEDSVPSATESKVSEAEAAKKTTANPEEEKREQDEQEKQRR